MWKELPEFSVVQAPPQTNKVTHQQPNLTIPHFSVQSAFFSSLLFARRITHCARSMHAQTLKPESRVRLLCHRSYIACCCQKGGGPEWASK